MRLDEKQDELERILVTEKRTSPPKHFQSGCYLCRLRGDKTMYGEVVFYRHFALCVNHASQFIVYLEGGKGWIEFVAFVRTDK